MARRRKAPRTEARDEPRAPSSPARSSPARSSSTGKLSKERVLRAAIALADARGLGAVTMRKLAEELGVEAMSLYHHVANKDAILDGMVDAIFAEIELPSKKMGWRTAMRRRALSARQVLLRHRWAIGLTESRTNPGLATLRQHDAVLGSLRRAGFSLAAAALAFSVLDSYVYGFALQEVSLPFQEAEGLHEMAGTILEQLRPDEYPHLVEIITDRALRPGYSCSNEFEPGLELILDGLERLRDAG